MTTSRRELRIKFEEIIKEETLLVKEEGDSQKWYDMEIARLADRFADTAIDILLHKKPAFDMKQAGLEWNILAGNEIDQEVIDLARLENDAIAAFESAFGIKGNWVWHPAKPQEEKVWKKFRQQVMQLFSADPDCFTKYVTWVYQPFSKGSMTGLQIKSNPQNFPDAWASFCMSTNYKARRVTPNTERTDLDASGAVISY